MSTNSDFDISVYFKLPIEYEKSRNVINQNIIDDFDFNKDESPYIKLFDNGNNINKLLLNKWNAYFSDDKEYLKNNQKFLEFFKTNYLNKLTNDNEKVYNEYLENENNESFKEKYEYITWEHLEFINKNPQVLQFMTYYNLFSPVLNLLIPIILLILPFFVIKLVRKQQITFETYKSALMSQLKNHSLGKIFSIFSSEVTINQKVFAAISVAFYFFSLYQNTLTCMKFYKNSFKIQDYLYTIRNHLLDSNKKMDILIKGYAKNNYFFSYVEYLKDKQNSITELIDELSFVTTNEFNHKNLFDFGKYLAIFYNLKHDTKLKSIIYFTFNLQCYINNINSLCILINDGKLNKCSFTKNRKSQIIKDQYYLYHDYDDKIKPIKNDVKLQNYIITGPNASGKTTLLKTTMLNIIFSQQFGYGFYKKAKIFPFKILNSYINIPDTTGRDSLFQAEARRCLNILNNIKDNKKDHAFIIFDEIYSGTNPYEASKSGIAFLDVLKKYKVEFLITTHFKELTTVKGIHNYHMDCKIENDKLKYTYKFIKGISDIRGGFNVLEELSYPKEIINKLK